MTWRFVTIIEKQRARLHRRIFLAALGRAILIVGLGIIGVGVSDYVFRFNDLGLRIITTAAIVGLAVVSWRWLIWPAYRSRIDGVALARWLEHRNNALAGKLAAAWEFAHLPRDDGRWGAPAFRQHVMQEIEGLADCVSESCAHLRGPNITSFYCATALLAAALCILILNPVIVGTAIIRLFNPFSQVTWPQVTHLKVLSYPEVVSRGGEFTVEVTEESGRLPQQVWIAVRDSGEESGLVAKFPMTRRANTFYFRREQVREDFEFRIWGGDDYSQPWRMVRVVEPPRVVHVTVRMKPPAYTGWQEETSHGVIRAVAGTQVTVTGRADRELSDVWIETSLGTTLRGNVAADRQQFVIPGTVNVGSPGKAQAWAVKESGWYKLRLKAKDGTTSVGEPEWEMRVASDLPPMVSAESPTAFLVATIKGRVPLRILARDDLALRSVMIQVGQEGQTVAPIMVFRGPQPHPLPSGKMSEFESWGQTFEEEETIDLSNIPNLSERPIKVAVIAEDYLGQSSASTPLVVDIVSEETFKERIWAECEQILDKLVDIKKRQAQINEGFIALWKIIRQGGRVDQQLANQLIEVDLLQTQLIQEVGGQRDGVVRRLGGLVRLIHDNRVGMAEETLLSTAEERLREAFQTLALPLQSHRGFLARWSERCLGGELGQALDREIQLAENRAAETETMQTRWEQELGAVLDILSMIRSRHSFRRQLEVILQTQQGLLDETQKAGVKTLGRTRPELMAEETAILGKLSDRQAGVAGELETLLSRVVMEAVSGPEEAGTPAADLPDQGGPSSRISNAASEDPFVAHAVLVASQTGLVAIMREAAGAIADNRMSEAVSLQRECVEILKKMLGILTEDRSQQIGDANPWTAIRGELERLAKAQQTLLEEFSRRWQQGAQPGGEDEFAQQQNEIRSSAESLKERTPADQTPEVRQPLDSAVSQMQQAVTAAQAGDRSRSLEHARQALEELQRARTLTSRRAEESELDELAALLGRAKQALDQLTKDQVDIRERTQKLDEVKKGLQSSSDWATWKEQVQGVYQRQEELREGVAKIRDMVSDLDVWASVLKDVEQDMELSGKRLQVEDAGAMTQAIQDRIIDSLNSLLQSFEPVAGEGQAGGEAGAQGMASPGQQEAGGTISWKLALQLRALRALQVSINARTEKLVRQMVEKNEAIDAAYLLAQLERDQSRVVQFLEDIRAQLSEDIGRRSPTERTPARPRYQEPRLPEGRSEEPPKPGTLDELLSP